MNIAEEMSGKRILIWGYGVEGKSTEHFLNKYCQAESIEIYEGKRDGIAEDSYDIIIKSPGIVMEEDHPKYTSQTELFLRQFRNQVIGITGTKGKSTTSAMLYAALRDCCGEDALLLGNIGRPCLDYYGEITENSPIVYEMSCHQLAHTKVSPHIAVFLNLYEEHLDYYGTVEKYFQAKCNITKYQSEDDILLLGENVPEIATKAKTVRIHKKEKFRLSINGVQNQYNAQFVYYVAAKLFGLDRERTLQSIEAFGGLPHRLQYIGTVDGVRYYDDSISTIPEAAMSAVGSIENVQAVLIGGKDRKINYSGLVRFIRNHKTVQFLCMYESGKRIYEELGDCENCHLVKDLQTAVRTSKRLTREGGACLLSPAAASYGDFKNFEERGEMFQKYVMEESGRTLQDNV